METDKFKLPRKLKKKLKKELWLHPPDDKGNQLAAWPSKSKQDFEACKGGKLERLFKIPSKKEQREYAKKTNEPADMSDSELKNAVDDIFSKEFRNSSYHILMKAKNSKKAVLAYYNFVNAYRMYQRRII